METKFNEQFKNFISTKKQILIPSKKKYGEMVAKIQECAESKEKKLTREELNLHRRYSIRIEQQKPVLYHSGESNKENAQRIFWHFFWHFLGVCLIFA